MLVLGTSVLCWSAPWARVICIALWRSRTVRQLCGYITGQDLLNYSPPVEPVATAQSTLAAEPERRDRHEKRVSNNLITDVLGGGIKVTQTIYQSQRRWIGIGWTSNLFPNERSPWYLFSDDGLMKGPMKLDILVRLSMSSNYRLRNLALILCRPEKRPFEWPDGNGSTQNGSLSPNLIRPIRMGGYIQIIHGKIPALVKHLGNILYFSHSSFIDGSVVASSHEHQS